MTFNHQAILRAYPTAGIINADTGVFDADGNQIELDQTLIDAAAIELAAEQAQFKVEQDRLYAYRLEADPLFFKAQRGEATTDEWTAKVAEIKARFPYPGGEE